MPPKVVVIGGTGYLGQFLVDDFIRRGWEVAYTHHSSQPIPAFEAGVVGAFRADLRTGEGLARCLQELAPLDAVINCAAISQPAACEKDPGLARAVNVPSALLAALQEGQARHGAAPLLVHLSTDQVYDGSRSGWTEDDPCAPVNAYGLTKLEAEAAVAAAWPRCVILRSSIIYGGDPPGASVGRSLFLQFVEGALAAGAPTAFFTDEWRSPVFVGDIVAACARLVERQDEVCRQGRRVFNMGGPQRLSRADMALAVAAARGYDPALVLLAASASRGVASPADISMASGRLKEATGVRARAFADALPLIFGPRASNP